MTPSPQMNKITSKTRKAFLAAGLLSGAALSSIVLAAPLKAAPLCVDGPLSSFAIGATCTDSQGYDFTFTSAPVGFLATDQFSFTSLFGNFQYSLQGSTAYVAPGPYSISYTVARTDGKKLYQYTSGLSTSDDTAAGIFKISAAASGNMSTTNLTTPQTIIGGTNSIPNLMSEAFTATLTPTAGNISAVTSMVKSKAMPEVPGPLPLLGAGAAFGFSRKLRNRVKLAA